jgi:putative oxidoreductase
MSIAASNPLRRAAILGLKITAALAWIAPLLTRLVIGMGLHFTGHGKLQNLDRTTSFFAGLGIPFAHANAIFVSTLEFVGGLCLVLGLGTRFFAFLLSCSLLVAVLTADRDDFVKKFPADLTDVTSFVYLMFLIWLALYGAGVVSLDFFIAKWLKLDKPRDNGSVA